MLVDTLSFYIVILLLTLAEGFCRLDPPSRLWSEWFGRLKMRRPFNFPGEDRWGWQYLTPGHYYASHLLPVALDGHGIAAASRDFAGERTLEGRADFRVPYGPATIDDRMLTVAKVPIRCQSATQAARLQLLLRQLQPLAPEQREAAIRKYLAECCDAAAGAQARRKTRQVTAALWRLGVVLQVLLLFGFPLAAALIGLTWAVVAIGVTAAAFSVVIANLHRGAYRQLFPELAATGWGTFLRLSVYPIGAASAATELTTEAVSAFHPVAFDPRQAGAEELRRAKHWLPREDAQAEQTRRWFYQALGEAIERSLRQQGLDPAQLFAVKRTSPLNLAYCPRCGGEFRFAQGACPDCPGRQVTPF